MQVGEHGAAAALLRDVAGLGPVRVVLRSCSGFIEIFCDTGCLELAAGWLNLRRPEAHLHVHLAALAGAHLLEAGSAAHPHAPSLWLLGRCGDPCVILVLDHAPAADRPRQRQAFDALRARWGERVVFGDIGGDERVLH